PSIVAAVQILDQLLRKRLRPATLRDHRVHQLATLQLQHHGSLPVGMLARASGVGERQLEREFKAAVGLSPKALARVLRFQRVFQAMEREKKWVDIAFECGYYDQAHLIADFNQFAGTSPTSFQLDEFELGRHFLRARRMSDFSKTPY